MVVQILSGIHWEQLLVSMKEKPSLTGIWTQDRLKFLYQYYKIKQLKKNWGGLENNEQRDMDRLLLGEPKYCWETAWWLFWVVRYFGGLNTSCEELSPQNSYGKGKICIRYSAIRRILVYRLILCQLFSQDLTYFALELIQ